MEANITSKAN